MEVGRKRPNADSDITPIATKKRALTGANGSPVNGDTEPDEDPFGEKLEMFRKEAIYRRMKHYCREHERSKARIQELEQRKNTCEAGLAAMSACWAQLVDTIKLIVKPDDVPQVELRSEAIFDLTAHLQDESPTQFATALGETVNATQLLMDKFFQIEESKRVNALQKDGFAECQKAQNECVVLRSQIGILKAKLKDTESQNESYHHELVVAQNRVERLQSVTVRETESRETRDKPKTPDEQKEDVAQSPVHAPREALSPLQTNGVHDTVEIDALEQKLRLREEKYNQLEIYAARLREEKDAMGLETKAPSLEFVSATEHYKTLSHHAGHLESQVESKIAEVSKLQDEIANLKATYKESEETIMRDTTQAISDFKAIITKRDQDNTRLREQREQLIAEQNERRARESIKFQSLQEYKTLLDSNTERIAILQSELRRTKAELAATSRQEDLMTFFLAGNHDEAEYFKGLKTKNAELESRVFALEQSLSRYDQEKPEIAVHLRAEADALAQVAEIKAKLRAYERVIGPNPELSDASELVAQLKQKEMELEQLRLLETQRKENEASLFSELEKLSTLWESLDRQLKSKVFDLANLEERLAKSSHEKAKSDNKFFAAMREKDAGEGARKTQQRTIEKQGKVIDRLHESDAQLRNQLSSLEKENTAVKKQIILLKDKLVTLDKEVNEARALSETERKRGQELRIIHAQREEQIKVAAKAASQKEEELLAAKVALEKQLAQLKKNMRKAGEVGVGSGGNPYSASYRGGSDPDTEKLANLEALITCSTCREVNAFRSTIITKCMHTFCKSCIDARLATRQRKCPACNLAFGHADVHQFFFQ